METELLPAPAGRPHNRRKHIVTLACTAVTCILLIMVYVKLESVNIIEEKEAGCQTGLRGSNGHKGREGAPWAECHPGEPGMHGSTELKGNTGSGPAGLLSEVETLTAGIQNLTGIVEGVIAGTADGVVIISLNSREGRTISSDEANGVAFNWHSRKVYWVESVVGIKIADLDGSHTELLISDTSHLCGLALDQITGNLYYGVLGLHARIQVCDSMGKKCAAVVSGVNNVGLYIYDIALFPSKGLIFWSSPFDKKSVIRANMDGTNATAIIMGDVYGLYVDELTEQLYCSSSNGSIERYDLNGDNVNVQLNTTIHPTDIAVHGETLYLSSFVTKGVFSVTNDEKVPPILPTTKHVYCLALYGRTKMFSGSNPCSNSHCSNLCVLTRDSYTCL